MMEEQISLQVTWGKRCKRKKWCMTVTGSLFFQSEAARLENIVHAKTKQWSKSQPFSNNICLKHSNVCSIYSIPRLPWSMYWQNNMPTTLVTVTASTYNIPTPSCTPLGNQGPSPAIFPMGNVLCSCEIDTNIHIIETMQTCATLSIKSLLKKHHKKSGLL